MANTNEATPLLAQSPAEFLRTLRTDIAQKIADDLKHLPALERTSASVAVPKLGDGYFTAVLPSGYTVLYRHLDPEETTQLKNGPVENAILIAGIEPGEKF